MKVVVIGSGGREHALAWKLSCSSRVRELICCPGNGGMEALGSCWTDLDPVRDAGQLVERIRESACDHAVIGPEAPLVTGLADRLREAGIAVFGPSAAASQLEGSKAYAKEFMARHSIPTAEFRIVREPQELAPALGSLAGPVVVKADGLAAGKGVIVTSDGDEATAAAHSMLSEQRFGAAGRTVILERRLEGVEMTMLVLVSGGQYALLHSAQDYKRLLDGNQGPNTGGMGSYSPTHLFTDDVRTLVVDRILEPTLAGLESEGIHYRGVLYLGLMLTTSGPQLLEYNVRFGDPETQPVLMRLRTDLLELFEAIENGRLDEVPLEWDPRSALCLVLASRGYPDQPVTGQLIDGPVHRTVEDDVQVFHAGTRLDETGKLRTSGGRVLGVTALGNDVEDARRRAYEEAARIAFEGSIRREDIGLVGTRT